MYETKTRMKSYSEKTTRSASSLCSPVRRLWQHRRMFPLLSVLLILSLLTAGCFESKIVTTKLNDPKQNPQNRMHGVFYALPRTVVKVNVPVVKTEIKDGFYKNYAQCFFPAEKVLDKGTEFDIDTDNVRFDRLAIPDSTQVYMIKMQGGMFETRNLEMSLTESGVFVKGVAETENQSLDLLTSTIKDVAGIAGKILVPGTNLMMRRVNRKQVNDFRSQLTPAQDECYGRMVVDRLEAAEAALDRESVEAETPPSAGPTETVPMRRARSRSTRATTTAAPVTGNNETTNTTDNPFGGTGEPGGQQVTDEQRAQQAEEARDRKERRLRQELAELKAGTQTAPANDRDRQARLEAELKELDAARKEDADFKQAKAIYDRIVELESKRDDLLGGSNFNAPLTNETFTKMLTELDATIKAYKGKYFLGTKTQTSTVLSFRMDPTLTTSPNTKLLFKFSKKNGVCLPLDAQDQGVIVNSDFASDTSCENPKQVQLIVNAGDNGEGGVTAGQQLMSQAIGGAPLNQEGKRGFYYRVPGRGVARLVMEGSPQIELGRDTLSIAQFGTIVSLPASTGGRRTKYTIELFESSGGLKNFIMGSDALVKQSNLKDITDASSTIVDAQNQRREARRKANQPPDELSELERQRKILEERKKIRDLEREMSETGTSNTNGSP